ncbi:hypothetical protein P3T25_005283 [Paraburkholderia sp. GAS32]
MNPKTILWLLSGVALIAFIYCIMLPFGQYLIRMNG